jgi:hypothetical protein
VSPAPPLKGINMRSKSIRQTITVLVVVFAIIYLVGFVVIPKTVAQGVFDFVLFYRVRFEVLGQSPMGHHYTDLFDVHGREITKILMNNSSLTWESVDVLIKWQPNLAALVNGHGDEAVISGEDVASVETYLDHLAQHASPELKSVIEEELSATPLEATVGMTMNQAWAYLNQDHRFQAQELEPQEFPSLKPGFASTVAGVFSDDLNYEIGFDEGTWAVSAWNNEVADSWVAENRALSVCILTTPWSVSDPYLTLDVSYKTLGDVNYKVQTADIKMKKTMTVYILYQPIDMAGQPFREDTPPFILYPGITNAAQCIEQSEVALASLHLVSNANP